MKIINESIENQFEDNLLSSNESEDILGGDCQKACGVDGCIWDNCTIDACGVDGCIWDYITICPANASPI